MRLLGGGIFRAALPIISAALVAGITRVSCALDTGEVPLPPEVQFAGPVVAAILAATIGQLYGLKDQEARFYKDLAHRASLQAESSSRTAVVVASGEVP